MSDINRVVLTARLTRDAELKKTNQGTSCLTFGIAVNEKKMKNDRWTDKAHFFDCIIWGKRGEGVAPYLMKGKQIALEGSLVHNRWKDGDNRREKVGIKVDSIQLLGGREKKEDNPPSPPVQDHHDRDQDYARDDFWNQENAY